MLLFFTLIIAICGLLYELTLWTLSSYLIWDSVKQFSFTIWFFMSGMWIGAYISRYLEKNALINFLKVELILSVVWASSVILLKLMYIYLGDSDVSFELIYFVLTAFLWSLVWIEIPLVATIYKRLKIKSQSIISDIFTFDYIGALFASLLFPIILLPYLWLYNISIFVWCLNLLVWFLYLNFLKTYMQPFPCKEGRRKHFFFKYFSIIFLILLYFVFLLTISQKLENFYLRSYFKEPILETYQTQYQNIVLTKRWEDLRMFLNGNIQFNSLDENRYHEALVDWSMKLVGHPKSPPGPPLEGGISPLTTDNFSVLVLWGWDWLAVRNLLEYKNIEKITLVELDPQMIKISSTQKDIVKLNKNSLKSEKLEIIIWDAFKFIEKNTQKYDMVIADFPDPRDVHTSKLYSKEFYIWVHGSLKKDGIFVTQASSAFFATKAFWSINKTLEWVFGNSLAYHRYLPSFGDWGFVLARKEGYPEKNLWNIICPNLWCTGFDDDYLKEKAEVKENSLTQPVIIEYYWEWYKKYNL